MKAQISDLNNASIIILDAGDFLKIKVDKIEKGNYKTGIFQHIKVIY